MCFIFFILWYSNIHFFIHNINIFHKKSNRRNKTNIKPKIHIDNLLTKIFCIIIDSKLTLVLNTRIFADGSSSSFLPYVGANPFLLLAPSYGNNDAFFVNFLKKSFSRLMSLNVLNINVIRYKICLESTL